MSFDPLGYRLGAGSGDPVWFLDTRMTVKAGSEQTGGSFTFLEWAAPAGFGPPRHIHQHEDEAFYLLEGQLSVECGDRSWTVGPRDFVFLPHGIPHAFVVCDGPVLGLQLTSPAGFEHYLGEVGRPAGHPGLPEPSRPDIAALAEASARYGVTVVGPPLTAGAQRPDVHHPGRPPL